MIWLRETVGWVLLGTGVAAFAVCYFVFLLASLSVQTVILGAIAFVLFRGGMQLLRVAMAARMSLEPTPVPRSSERPRTVPTPPTRTPTR